jgi:VanZ family protein
MAKLIKAFKLWGPVVIWAGIIFFFSSIPYLRTDLGYDFLLRKIAHIAEYFVLAFLLYRAFKGSFNMDFLRLFMYPALFAFLYAVSDEIHQYFVLGRNCSLQDVLVDSAGIIGFYAIINLRKDVYV